MEKEIHLLWKFLWHYCDFRQEKITAQGWKISSRETISKEQHVNNNGIYVIFNMAAVIHHFSLNELNS